MLKHLQKIAPLVRLLGRGALLVPALLHAVFPLPHDTVLHYVLPATLFALDVAVDQWQKHRKAQKADQEQD